MHSPVQSSPHIRVPNLRGKNLVLHLSKYDITCGLSLRQFSLSKVAVSSGTVFCDLVSTRVWILQNEHLLMQGCTNFPDILGTTSKF